MTLPSPPPARKRSQVLPILITIACGFLLALGSCFGAVATINTGGGRRFGWAIVTGVVVGLGGIIWGLVAIAVHVFGSKKEQP